VTGPKLGANAVTNDKFRSGAALSVVGVAGSAGNVADIAAGAGAANRVLRVDTTGNAIGWGALNLASTNAVTGVLGATYGGTGRSVALVFPNQASQVIGSVKRTISPGSTSYNLAQPFGDVALEVSVWSSARKRVYPGVARSATAPYDVVVTFGYAAADTYTVLITGTDQL
jgi:hypothetical protein